MLIAYLIIPFIFAIMLSLCVFLKNPIYIRRFSKILYFIYFAFSCVVFLFMEEGRFSFFNVSFDVDKNAQCFGILNSFIFFIFSIISKNFILKMNKVFYSAAFLLLGLVNILIYTDNVFLILISLFWVFLNNYLLSISYCDDNSKKQITYQLGNYIFWLFISCALILVDFAKYFLINEIEFSFLNFSQNFYRIDDFSIVLALIGFLIIVGCLFNFYPFNYKNLSNTSVVNPCVFSLNNLSFLILGGSLLLKCHKVFDYYIFQMQGALSIYLLVNLLIYLALIFSLKKMFKFLSAFLCILLIPIIFSMFSFEGDFINIFIYYILVLSLSYSLCSIVFMVLKDKFKTDNVEEFKKINDGTKISHALVVISLLNIGFVPIFPLFSAQLICMMLLFSIEYDVLILNLVPYFLIFALFLISLCIFNLLYKILIEPVEKFDKLIAFSNHQILVCMILFFALILLGIFPQSIFEQINMIFENGQF